MEFGLAPSEPYVLACSLLPAPPPIPQSLPLALRDRAAHGRSRLHVGSYSRIISSQGRSTWENSYVAGLDVVGCIISDHTTTTELCLELSRSSRGCTVDVVHFGRILLPFRARPHGSRDELHSRRFWGRDLIRHDLLLLSEVRWYVLV